jgi:hypothetical protein
MRHHDAVTPWEVEAERRREILLPDRRPLIDDAIDRPMPAAWRGAMTAPTRWIADRRPDAARADRHIDAPRAAAPTDCRHGITDGRAPA